MIFVVIFTILCLCSIHVFDFRVIFLHIHIEHTRAHVNMGNFYRTIEWWIVSGHLIFSMAILLDRVDHCWLKIFTRRLQHAIHLYGRWVSIRFMVAHVAINLLASISFNYNKQVNVKLCAIMSFDFYWVWKQMGCPHHFEHARTLSHIFIAFFLQRYCFLFSMVLTPKTGASISIYQCKNTKTLTIFWSKYQLSNSVTKLLSDFYLILLCT